MPLPKQVTPMHEIVCATRGGEGSRAVQLAAIERAKGSGQSLVFLYVASPSSLQAFDPAMQPAVQEELTWMGRALLYIAKQRANAANLDTLIVIREGDVREEICRYLAESDASLLLLGAPRGTTANVFGDDAVERFAQEVREESGVDVEIIRP